MEENKISITCTSEYKDYVYNAKHDVWTIISLKAPCHEEEEDDDKRAPIDIVAVMDKSGSMAGSKLALVKTTLEFVLTQLSKKDRFSLVTYDTNVYVDVPLMAMTSSNKEAALNKIKAITDGSSTNLSGGLIKGLCQIIDRSAEEKNSVASVLLFTDGLANVGITHAAGIVAAMEFPKKFDVPAKRESMPSTSFFKKKTKKGRSKEAASPPEPAEQSDSGVGGADASVYTFGFGSDHDEKLLKQISDAGKGMYYFIETEDKIGESFAHCLGGLMTTVAQGIQLCVTTETGVIIKEVHTSKPFQNDGKSVKIDMGDLQSEEKRDISLELTVHPVTEPDQNLFNATVDYFNVITNTLESASSSLSVKRPEKESVRSVENVQPHITKDKCRVKLTQAMKQSNDRANAGDMAAAKSLLMEQIQMTKACRSQVAEFHDDEETMEELDAMVADLDEVAVNVESRSNWEKKGKKMHAARQQEYECQRSSNVKSKNFATKGKSNLVLKQKKFASGE